ncbi:hypothetical protein NIES4103_16170 [Nostoc sp. NIES-4103]|nr:hypothetical protein NIES4103_16170 [Nostoc sp. NIES-4103]
MSLGDRVDYYTEMGDYINEPQRRRGRREKKVKIYKLIQTADTYFLFIALCSSLY